MKRKDGKGKHHRSEGSVHEREGKHFSFTPILSVGIVALLLLSVFFLGVAQLQTLQSNDASIAQVRFVGEYRVDYGEWQPINYGEHISSTAGDVTLRGYFALTDPVTGEHLGALGEGGTVSLYLNHIAGTVTEPAGNKWSFDAENEMFGEDACASMWCSYTVTETSDGAGKGLVTIVLHNPHAFGNENAIDDFLEYMSLAPGAFLEEEMLGKGETERSIGLVISIASVILLGIASFSTVMHIKYSKELWLIGLVSLFAGGYFLFGAFAVSFWHSPNIVNTRALGLCMMLFMLFSKALAAALLRGVRKRIVMITALASGGVVLTSIILSFFKSIDFYDTWGVWAVLESFAALITVVCLLASLKGESLIRKLMCISGAVILFAFPIDVIATFLGWWEGGLILRHLFIVFFAIALVMVIRVVPSHINAVNKAKELETEQQALRLELQESRISIMLSQMQPHFIFNTLNTIYHLCEINPDVARSTISSFSEYLRNNIDTLGQSEMIAFEKELSFVRTYLDIEKVRFDDELEITLDIGATDFKLPVLTVQPLVENAVKHGTSKKEGVAELYVSATETEDFYEIVIRDTGVGFDTESYESDGHKHVGISSVRQRLKNLCNGTLEIESERGVGTTATVRIPKEERSK